MGKSYECFWILKVVYDDGYVMESGWSMHPKIPKPSQAVVDEILATPTEAGVVTVELRNTKTFKVYTATKAKKTSPKILAFNP